MNLLRTKQQSMKQKRGNITAEWLFIHAFIFPLNTTKQALVLTLMHISTKIESYFVIFNIKNYSYSTTVMINHWLKSACAFLLCKIKPLLYGPKARLNMTCFSLHDRPWLYRTLRPVREPALCGRALSLSVRQRSLRRWNIIMLLWILLSLIVCLFCLKYFTPFKILSYKN